MLVPYDVLVGYLKKTELFGEHTVEQIRGLVAKMDLLRVPAEHNIIEEGGEGDAFFMVLEGEVAVVKNDGGRAPHVLSHLEHGECFGELALLDNAPRLATVQTVGPTILARLSKADFDTLIDANDPGAVRLLRAMAKIVAERQRGLTHVLMDVVDGGYAERADPHLQAFVEALENHAVWN